MSSHKFQWGWFCVFLVALAQVCDVSLANRLDASVRSSLSGRVASAVTYGGGSGVSQTEQDVPAWLLEEDMDRQSVSSSNDENNEVQSWNPKPMFYSLHGTNKTSTVTGFHLVEPNVPVDVLGNVTFSVEYSAIDNTSEPLIYLCITSQMPPPMDQFLQWKEACQGVGGDAFYVEIPNGQNTTVHEMEGLVVRPSMKRHGTGYLNLVGFDARPGATYVSVALAREVDELVEVKVELSASRCGHGVKTTHMNQVSMLSSPFFDLLPYDLLDAPCVSVSDFELNVLHGLHLKTNWNYFTFTILPPLHDDRRPSQLVINLNTDETASDDLKLELYLRYLGIPSEKTYDYMGNLDGAKRGLTETLDSVPFTTWESDLSYSSDWYVGIKASAGTSAVTMKIDYTLCIDGTFGEPDSKRNEQNNLASNATVGYCKQNSTKSGTDLDMYYPATVRKGSVQPKKMDYYQISSDNAEGIAVSVAVDGDKVKAPPIFLGMDIPPTQDAYIQTSQENIVNELIVPPLPLDNTPHTWFIGIGAGDSKSAISYRIWSSTTEGLCAGNCTSEGKGTCQIPAAYTDITAPTCHCHKDQRGVDCSEDQNYLVQYIVLICVGGALVLFVVIGVPIYCYLNKRNAYETV